MPIYEFQCERCRRVVERFSKVVKRARRIRCVCGGDAKRIISAPSVHIFQAYIEHNMAHEPVSITSRKQLRREAAQRGLTAAAAE